MDLAAYINPDYATRETPVVGKPLVSVYTGAKHQDGVAPESSLTRLTAQSPGQFWGAFPDAAGWAWVDRGGLQY